MYMTGHIKIHAEYMHDTCKIHRIRILITNVPKFDNNGTVTRQAPRHKQQYSGINSGKVPVKRFRRQCGGSRFFLKTPPGEPGEPRTFLYDLHI